MNRVRRVENAVLRALLRRVDARSLGRHDLVLLVDVLTSALAAADPSPDLGK